ncbi:MAG: L-2-hydroxyglutarate oxidase [Polyangiaceae bacterium]
MPQRVVIVGGGIVGCATALKLLERRGDLAVTVLEKEPKLAAHQTGHNSGVIHAGLYYKPGSVKADTCARGRESLIQFCEAKGIPYDRCGKLVVATDASQIPKLDELERRGRANGLVGLTRLGKEQLLEYEPHVAGVAGLHVAETGIVDYARVTNAYAEAAKALGAEVVTSARVEAITRDGGEIVVDTSVGARRGDFLVNCAGLASDRVAHLAGVDPAVRIVPFRGEYYEIVESRRSLVKNLIYPVPDPSFPFLGVHFTRRIGGEIEAGPNAVLAFKREGYSKTSFDLRDAREIATFPGVWKLVGKHWRTGIGEFYRSFVKSAFVRALQALVPEVRAEDLAPAGAGVRAQAMRADGALVDDFWFAEAKGMVHVLNAPSPAATASLAIGESIADRALAQMSG